MLGFRLTTCSGEEGGANGLRPDKSLAICQTWLQWKTALLTGKLAFRLSEKENLASRGVML